MSDIIKYCKWYIDTDIYEIPSKLKKDNVPLKYSELFKSLCVVGIDEELLSNLTELEKACKFFINNGTKSIDIYQNQLKRIQNRIENY